MAAPYDPKDFTDDAPAGSPPRTGSEAEERLAELRSRREAAMKMTGRKWSNDEILDGIWDMYLGLCEMEDKRDHTSSTRYPDFEQALGQMERSGLPPNSEVSDRRDNPKR